LFCSASSSSSSSSKASHQGSLVLSFSLFVSCFLDFGGHSGAMLIYVLIHERGAKFVESFKVVGNIVLAFPSQHLRKSSPQNKFKMV